MDISTRRKGGENPFWERLNGQIKISHPRQKKITEEESQKGRFQGERWKVMPRGKHIKKI